MVNSRLLWFASIAFLFATVGTPSMTKGSQGSPIVIVTKLEDTDDGRCDVDDCSLREAVGSLVNGGKIIFDIGLFKSQRSEQISLHTLIDIENYIEIMGPNVSAALLILKIDYPTVVFRINPNAHLRLQYLSLTSIPDFVGSGGVINNRGTLTVVDCILHDNFNSAIINNRGETTIIRSSFYRNQATAGGAILNVAGSVHIKNSTFYENKAGTGDAIDNVGLGKIDITYSTFSENKTDDDVILSTAFIISNNGTIKISNSVLFGRSGTYGKNCVGVKLIDEGNNLQFPDATCGLTIPTLDPLMLALADNGGPTLTLALMDGSPAIDAGDPKVCAEKIGLVDQRGMPRSDGKCDIGAYEKQR